MLSSNENGVVLNDVDWVELRQLLLDITREHDETTAFTNDNMGLHALMDLMVICYEHGRQRTLPPNWVDAHRVMLGRRAPLYKIHVQQRELVRKQRTDFEHLEQLDMTELTGGPMQQFLRDRQPKKAKKK